jgi:hypothetical protein
MNNVSIIRRDDITLIFEFTIDDAPVDLTDCTCYLTAKKELGDNDEDAVLKKDWNTHSDPEFGLTSVFLSNADTNIKAGSYFLDIQIKNPDGFIVSTNQGVLTVKQDVTVRTT